MLHSRGRSVHEEESQLGKSGGSLSGARGIDLGLWRWVEGQKAAIRRTERKGRKFSWESSKQGRTGHVQRENSLVSLKWDNGSALSTEAWTGCGCSLPALTFVTPPTYIHTQGYNSRYESPGHSSCKDIWPIHLTGFWTSCKYIKSNMTKSKSIYFLHKSISLFLFPILDSQTTNLGGFMVLLCPIYPPQVITRW